MLDPSWHGIIGIPTQAFVNVSGISSLSPVIPGTTVTVYGVYLELELREPYHDEGTGFDIPANARLIILGEIVE
jgi:hypothetical protein